MQLLVYCATFKTSTCPRAIAPYPDATGFPNCLRPMITRRWGVRAWRGGSHPKTGMPNTGWSRTTVGSVWRISRSQAQPCGCKVLGKDKTDLGMTLFSSCGHEHELLHVPSSAQAQCNTKCRLKTCFSSSARWHEVLGSRRCWLLKKLSLCFYLHDLHRNQVRVHYMFMSSFSTPARTSRRSSPTIRVLPGIDPSLIWVMGFSFQCTTKVSPKEFFDVFADLSHSSGAANIQTCSTAGWKRMSKKLFFSVTLHDFWHAFKQFVKNFGARLVESTKVKRAFAQVHLHDWNRVINHLAEWLLSNKSMTFHNQVMLQGCLS